MIDNHIILCYYC